MGGRTLAAIAVAGTFALAGCGGGGGSSDEDDVNAAIDAARQAALSGDAAGFCDSLSANVINQLEANDDINSVVPTCEKLVDANAPSMKEISGPEPKITSVTVDGDKATATGELGGTGQRRFVTLGKPITIQLIREDGQWKLATLPPTS